MHTNADEWDLECINYFMLCINKNSIENFCLQEFEIFFVDYGNAERVGLSSVRCLTQETAAIPAQAVCCQLFAIKPKDVSH